MCHNCHTVPARRRRGGGQAAAPRTGLRARLLVEGGVRVTLRVLRALLPSALLDGLPLGPLTVALDTSGLAAAPAACGAVGHKADACA